MLQITTKIHGEHDGYIKCIGIDEDINFKYTIYNDYENKELAVDKIRKEYLKFYTELELFLDEAESIEDKENAYVYFPDSATGLFKRLSEFRTKEELIKYITQLLPHNNVDIFIPDKGVDYIVMTNQGEGPGYGDETYFVKLNDLDIIKG